VNIIPALIATFISGLSTAVGGLFIMFWKKPSNTSLGHMLSLSAGVMIYISFMDLLRESVIRIGFKMANLWFFAGMLLFAAIVALVPEPEFVEKASKKSKAQSDNGKPSEVYLKKLGVITAIGISLHNFPEGMAVYISCLKGIEMGLPLTLAIAAHNIPEGMAVAAPIYGATHSKWQAMKYTILSGLCEPAGAILIGWGMGPYLTEYVIQCMLAGVAGIMVYMSIRELLPATYKYIKPGPAGISFIIGMAMIGASVHYLHSMLPHSHAPLYPTSSSSFTTTTSSLPHDHSSCGHEH